MPEQNIRLFRDGDQWCALLGENLQVGTAGFGDTRSIALTNLAAELAGGMGSISDGFHSFDALYKHRCLLFVALLNLQPKIAWRSRRHDDDSEWSGWFIAGLKLPSGTITYHLPIALWDLLVEVETFDRAPVWDGHTSADVIDRLTAWVSDADNFLPGCFTWSGNTRTWHKGRNPEEGDRS